MLTDWYFRIRGNNSDSEDEAEPDVGNPTSNVSQLTLLPSPFHLPSNPTDMSISDEEKLRLTGAATTFSLENRPFLAALFHFLDYSDNDYIQLFSIALIYAMQVILLHTNYVLLKKKLFSLLRLNLYQLTKI